jgi:4'-phosphopantetheinyl transferase
LKLQLQHDEVHVWRSDLHCSGKQFAYYESLLSEDERERARRQLIEGARKQFILARGRVRTLLGEYLQLHPSEIAFEYGPYGKPALSRELGAELRFNIAHSRGHLALAVGIGSEIGIDFESLESASSADVIVRHYFSPAEESAYFSLPPAERAIGFLQYWTRKEALLKAKGFGFARSLREADEHCDWWVQSFMFDESFVGALAGAGLRKGITRWQWHREGNL